MYILINIFPSACVSFLHILHTYITDTYTCDIIINQRNYKYWCVNMPINTILAIVTQQSVKNIHIQKIRRHIGTFNAINLYDANRQITMLLSAVQLFFLSHTYQIA